MDDELNREPKREPNDPDRWSDSNGPLYLPDDWFDEPEPPPGKKPLGRRPWFVILAIIVAIAMVVYYTVPILVPVHADRSRIPLDEEIYYT